MSDQKPVRCGCGGEAVVYPSIVNNTFFVQCERCRTMTFLHLTEAEAITAWNRAMSGATDTNVGDKFDKDINVLCKERTAKVEDLDRRSETSLSWEGTCTKCGSYTMRDMNYCFHCGARLEWK